jgi:transposase
MSEIVTIGLDLAKNVFQVHGVAADGRVIVRRQLRRSDVLTFFRKVPACLVGMEACGSAHYWAREIAALAGIIHQARFLIFLDECCAT